MSITSITQKVSSRVAAGAVGAAMVLTLGFGAVSTASAAGLTSAQVSSILSLLQSFGADQATINNVNAALTGQPTTSTGSTGSSTGGSCYTFTRDLTSGSTGADVKALQQFLNSHSAVVSASGAGSVGYETMTFGPATKAALAKYQAANKISPASGYFGPKTRAAVNAACGGSTSTGSTGSTGTVTPTGPGLTVSMATQPANTLAPQGTSRVPFTSFTLTNNTSSAVTVSSVTVQRAGLAQDAAFSGVVLLDSNGLQVGISHTFNSNHQTNIGDNFVLNPGQSMTYTVAGNMAADLSSYAGEIAQIQVVGINTSVPVSGSLPIIGAQQTLNSSLAVGSVSTSTSSYDPGTAQTKNIGDTNVRLSGVRFTAGSTEDLKLYNIRWRQVGTASASDISNVVTYVNGTAYPTTVDSSGKYYTTNFPNGILITKGNSVDVYVQSDMTGSNSASRTVEMDIDKVTDVYFVGQLYGYGIAPSGTYTPWYKGNVTTINGGTVTAIQNATSVASQNIPLNVNNTVLGGFQTNFLGEPTSVTGMTFRLSYGSTAATGNLPTSVSIIDQNGATIAGPKDAVVVGGGQSKVAFTDSVTFPIGIHTYTLVGKLPTGVTNGDTVTASTTPSSDWTSPTGQTTGNSVTLPSSTVTLNTMTIQKGKLTITASPNPVAANIVSGVVGVNLGNIQLDASQSGEDVRLASLPVSIIVNDTTHATDLNTCQLYNGSTAVNTGSNVVNPTSSNTETSNSTTAATFTFDNALTIPKGTVVTLALNCNIVSNATLTSVQIGVNSGDTFSATGVQSGATITPTATSGTGGTQTLASSGSLTATAASTAVAQPSLALVAAGTTGVTMGQVKFHASKEDINVTKIGLTLAQGTYGSLSNGNGGSSNSGVGDVTTAYIYNGSTQVGTVVFTGSTQTATSTLTTPIKVAKDTDVYLTIKTDLASIGVSASGGIGDTVKVDPLNAQANGLASGQTINISATAGVNGVQMFKSVPTVANSNVTCTSGNGCNGTSQVLKQFTVTANASGPVSVNQIKFTLSTTSANVTNFLVSVYDQNGNVASSTFGVKQCSAGCTGNAPTLTIVGGPVIIPAGTTYTFKAIGDVAGSGTTYSVNTRLNGDSAAIAKIGTTPTYIGTTTTVADADTNSAFIWSDNATTTAAASDVDWFNGYQVNGLPSVGF